jgi:hypothetical protein
MLTQKQSIFAQNVALLLQYIRLKDFQVTLGEAFRTEAQAKIYAQEGKGIIDSLHRKRLAIDLNLLKDGLYFSQSSYYEPFGVYWETLHPLNRWGGRFKRVDANHFEMQDL